MTDILKVSGLTVRYDNKPALENVSFGIGQGEYVCIVGGNGAGKTTLVKALLGLVSHSGEVEWLTDRRKVSYVPQTNPADRDFPASVWEVVRSGRMGLKGAIGFYTKADNEAALKAMELMGVAELASRKVGTLSGGQQQRVLLARALSSSPSVLVLDEPSSALDKEMTESFYELTARLNKDSGVTLIMITHSLDDAVRYADKIISVNVGVEFVGSAHEYLEKKGMECRHG